MSKIVEQVKSAVLSNPERPNAAGLEVVDAEIDQSRKDKWNRLVEAAKSVEPKEKLDGP